MRVYSTATRWLRGLRAPRPRTLAVFSACFSALFLGVLWGTFAGIKGLPPSNFVAQSTQAAELLWDQFRHVEPWYVAEVPEVHDAVRVHSSAMEPGLTLVAGVGKEGRYFARLVTPDGKVLHEWDVSFDIVWPANQRFDDQNAFADYDTNVNGVHLSRNGDLTFNISDRGLAQVDFCGKVNWRVRRLTHHSIFADDRGQFWVPAERLASEPLARFPNYVPPFRVHSLLVVSQDGKVVREIDVADMLRNNGLGGLLYLSPHDLETTGETGDVLHLNDVKVFPSHLKPGIIGPGDIMVSLRNLNSVFIFDSQTLALKASVIGKFVHQHDPQFIDGNTISVYDNNVLRNDGDETNSSSRIVTVSLRTGARSIVYEGNAAHPFYTETMGRHRWLKNGDLLIAYPDMGKVLEVDSRGKTVWEYWNIIAPGQNGLMNDAERLPKDYFGVEDARRISAACNVKT